MRIAITGRGGQLASAMLERAAVMPDVSMLAFMRPSFDLARPESALPALRSLKPDIVVNAAAYTAVDQAEAEPETAMAVNGAGAGAVAAAARTLGIPIIQISTDYVFNGSGNSPYVETDVKGPVNAYGRSKLAGEEAVRRETPRHAILRTSWVYAAAGKNFFRTMLRLSQERDEVGVVADQYGAPGYAPDLAEGVIKVCRNILREPENETLLGTFHMTGGGEASWAEFAEAIFAGSARRGGPSARVKRISTQEYPTPARRPLNARLDCGKLASVHGVSLPHWRDGLERGLDRWFTMEKIA